MVALVKARRDGKEDFVQMTLTELQETRLGRRKKKLASKSYPEGYQRDAVSPPAYPERLQTFERQQFNYRQPILPMDYLHSSVPLPSYPAGLQQPLRESSHWGSHYSPQDSSRATRDCYINNDLYCRHLNTDQSNSSMRNSLSNNFMRAPVIPPTSFSFQQPNQTSVWLSQAMQQQNQERYSRNGCLNKSSNTQSLPNTQSDQCSNFGQGEQISVLKNPTTGMNHSSNNSFAFPRVTNIQTSQFIDVPSTSKERKDRYRRTSSGHVNPDDLRRRASSVPVNPVYTQHHQEQISSRASQYSEIHKSSNRLVSNDNASQRRTHALVCTPKLSRNEYHSLSSTSANRQMTSNSIHPHTSDPGLQNSHASIFSEEATGSSDNSHSARPISNFKTLSQAARNINPSTLKPNESSYLDTRCISNYVTTKNAGSSNNEILDNNSDQQQTMEPADPGAGYDMLYQKKFGSNKSEDICNSEIKGTQLTTHACPTYIGDLINEDVEDLQNQNNNSFNTSKVFKPRSTEHSVMQDPFVTGDSQNRLHVTNIPEQRQITTHSQKSNATLRAPMQQTQPQSSKTQQFPITPGLTRYLNQLSSVSSENQQITEYGQILQNMKTNSTGTNITKNSGNNVNNSRPSSYLTEQRVHNSNSVGFQKMLTDVNTRCELDVKFEFQYRGDELYSEMSSPFASRYNCPSTTQNQYSEVYYETQNNLPENELNNYTNQQETFRTLTPNYNQDEYQTTTNMVSNTTKNVINQSILDTLTPWQKQKRYIMASDPMMTTAQTSLDDSDNSFVSFTQSEPDLNTSMDFEIEEPQPAEDPSLLLHEEDTLAVLEVKDEDLN